jgi:hypothetical protein
MNSYKDNIKTLCKGKIDPLTQEDVDVEDEDLVVFYPESRENTAVCVNKDTLLTFWNGYYGVNWASI